MSNIKRNFAYNLILTIAGYVLPLLTYPYISRVLGVVNIGLVNYVDSIINYFVLFAMLGISSLGVREIARVKDDLIKCKEVFSTLLGVNVVLTLFSVVLLLCMTYMVEYFHPYREYLLIGIMKLVFSAFLLEWFFQGMSDFKFITIRSLIIRALYVILVFLFVRAKDDLGIYYFLTVLTIVINAVVNFWYSKRYVSFSFKFLNLRPYLLPVISYGFYRILTSMYTTFNVTYLGSVSDVAQVGYFVTATKLHAILMGIFTAFTTVMVPHVSELLAKSEYGKLRGIADKTFSIIFMISIPIIVLSYFYAPLIIKLIAGFGYEGAIIPFRIVMLLLLVIAMEQIIIQQFLMAIRDSKCIVWLSSIGALVGIIFNILLTARIGSVGAAISWVASEMMILLVSLFYYNKYFKMKIPLKSFLSNLVVSIPYILICLLFSLENMIVNASLSILFSSLWFFISNIYIIKNEHLILFVQSVASKFSNKI